MTLALVGAWLLAVGVADLGRLSSGRSDDRHRWAWVVAGAVVLGLVLVAVDLGWWSRVLLLVSGGALLAGWTLPRSASVRAGAFGSGLVGSGLVAGLVVSDRAWPAWLEATALGRWTTSEVLVTAGVVVAQVSTANLLVRLLLDAVGVPATDGEKQLRGGRVLGPMERVFLVALGALGELTAAAVVIAAKGLLRFPEVQRAQRRDRETDGPSDVTEYFLIGSLASWLLALGGAALVHLAGSR